MESKTKQIALILLFLPCLASANIIINEICWMGDETNSSHEWIELFNSADETINLNNWTLTITKTIIPLKGEIKANDFYLLERNDDNAVTNKSADLIYKKALNNKGENVELRDNNNNLVDSAPYPNKWPAGNNETKQTMERKSTDLWQTSLLGGGSPKTINSKEEKIEKPAQNKENNSFPFSISAFFVSLSSGFIALYFKKG